MSIGLIYTRILSANSIPKSRRVTTKWSHSARRACLSQYITGHQEFWGLDFLVTPAVLIPRPETEHVVETVLELVREGDDHSAAGMKIVDVGTGSGCIALALANELPSAELYATDISPEALEIAKANAARLQLEGRVQFLHCDVLQPVGSTSLSSRAGEASLGPPTLAAPFHDLDFVISNPPYVAYRRCRQGAKVGAGI